MDRRSLIFVVALTIGLFFVNQWFSSSGDQKNQQAIAQKKIEEPQTQQAQAQEAPAAPAALPKSSKEQFFVIENDYQQLVFSNIGGALAEINLPLASKEFPDSPVRPIEFDRVMLKEFPYNDHYPAMPYQINRGAGVESVAEGKLGGYYPLLRRSIMGPKGGVAFPNAPRYYALNILADDGSLNNQSYQVTRLEKNLIEFELVQSQRRIVKTYTFSKDPSDSPYCVELTVRIEGDARNVWMTSGVPEVELISGNPAPTLKYRMIRSNQKAVIEQISLPKETTTVSSIYPDWICNSNGFMGLIIDPLTEIGAGFRASIVPGNLDPTRLTLVDAQYQLYPATKYPGYELQLPLKAQTMKFLVYAGPFEDAILAKVDQTYSDPATGYNPSYISALSFHGWFTFISEPFARFLFVLMKFFYQITSSWGISIILLTIALRIMLYPLNAWSIKSTLRMQEVAPKVAAIQEKHKKDPKRAQMEVMNLYREKGVNPLTGCFPLLIQLPFLIGMFDLLKSMFELRGASFIPGWIDNLTAPDVLFSWNYPVIFFGTDFHLLPFLLGAVMWVQQRFSSSTPKDPAMMTDQQKQQKMMGNIMTIVFTVMFYHFPSGLNIYWLSSMALGILQQWFMNRKMVQEKAIVKT
ncbi:MAG: membrane protein insertase YidC [Verrucomicrobia bacterium]|nr:membrane protein insertase YidC [Verrucomicrobiota bacterium]